MTDFNLEQYTDNDNLDLLEHEIWTYERERIAHQLHLDLAISLPDEPEVKREVLKERAELFDTLRVLNNKLSSQAKPEIVQWDDLPDIEREWLIASWLPANTVTMFTGEGGAGKSWLTLQAVCQIACGFRNAYLNPDFKKIADVNQHRHVVFATYEDEPIEIKRRLQALASGMEWIKDSLKTIMQYVHIVDMRGIGSVWGPGIGKHIANTGDLLSAGEDLRTICEEKNARLLVMDPLSGAFGGNENDRTAVYDFVSSFRGWGDAVGCAMLVIGHLPKSAEGKAAGFSGSTAWEASARSMWMLSKRAFKENSQKDSKDSDNNKKTRYYWALSHTKSNYAPLQGDIPLIKSGTGWWTQAATRNEATQGYEAYEKGINQSLTEETDDEGYQIEL